MALEKEIKTYVDKLPELLAHEGKFVVIHDSEVAGFYDTYSDAVRAGYDRFALQPFMVKQVSEVEQIQFISTGPCPT